MTIANLYPLCQEAIQALDPHYRPAMQQALADAGLEGRAWGLLLFAQGAEPHALSADMKLLIRGACCASKPKTRPIDCSTIPGAVCPTARHASSVAADTTTRRCAPAERNGRGLSSTSLRKEPEDVKLD